MFDFTGRYAVVTGARRGIGAAIAKRFYDDGCSGVAIVARNGDIPWVKEVDPNGERIFIFEADTADKEAIADAFAKIYEKFGRVDFLVNNAGIIKDGMFHKMSDEAWYDVIDVDLNGVYNCTRQVINPMRDQEFGRIINMSSVSAYGNLGQTNYSAAKAGLVAFTKALAKESGKKGITVNAILPMAVETDMTAGIGGDGPKEKMGQPEDLASLVAYLCTDEAWFVSAASIDFNGGRR